MIDTTATQAPPETHERSLLDRQTGIKSWERFEKVTSNPEKREPEPLSVVHTGETSESHAPDSVKGLTREERNKWRKTGELPKAKTEQEASSEPNAKDTGRETPSKADAEDVGIGPTDPQTPDEVAAYKVRYSEFLNSISRVEPDLRTDLMNINLDSQRGALVMHSLADCSQGQRKHVAKLLANRVDMQLLMTQRDARGNYVYRPDEVAGVIRMWAREYKPAVKQEVYVTRAPKPVAEVGGRGTTPTDSLEAAAKASPGVLTREFKAEANRRYAQRSKDKF